MTQAQKIIISQAVMERKNILVAGGTGSGKTTLTNAIVDEIVNVTPDHRLVIMEDTPEIQCNTDNKVILRTTAQISMQKLLKITMRLRPDRIVVGEVRGSEALALLKAWNTGHPGGVATLHANSASAGLTRLKQLIDEDSRSPMHHLIGEAVDLVIYITKTAEGRRVKEIISVNGYKDKQYNLTLME